MDNFGQLLMTGIKGTSLSSEELEFIEKENIGGIILFSQNFEDPGQLAELVNSIQKLRDEYPLFISVDHEGGKVMRFKTHFTQFPSMLELAQLNSPKLVYEVHEVMAKELSACGINLIYSPTCDILTNTDNKVIGNRSYGRSTESVEKFISAAIRGLQTNKVLACAKHFPGHGDTSIDSHQELPIIKTPLDVLKQREMVPFIKASKSRVEFMMMGHLLVDCLDEQKPASLSPRCYDFLRDETKFTKIIITDEMEMKAITNQFTVEEAAIGALGAGADILLYKNLDDARKALDAVREAVKKRVLIKESLLDKLNRIEKCKKEYFSNYQPLYIPKVSESFNTNQAKDVLAQLKMS